MTHRFTLVALSHLQPHCGLAYFRAMEAGLSDVRTRTNKYTLHQLITTILYFHQRQTGSGTTVKNQLLPMERLSLSWFTNFFSVSARKHTHHALTAGKHALHAAMGRPMSQLEESFYHHVWNMLLEAA